MKLLEEGFKDKGVTVTHNRLTPAKVALIPIAMNPQLLQQWKKPGRVVIQRLDGVFYDPDRSDFDEEKNSDLLSVYKTLTDVIVYQSEYSRKQCDHYLGSPRPEVELHTVLNGTDLGLFNPHSNPGRDSSDSIRFITTGNFRDQEMLVPILEALDLLKPEVPFTLTIVGPIVDSDWVKAESRPYVKCLGSLDRSRLATELRNADVFLFSFLNPNCPNSVIEATASGLPVVSYDSGAMRELCSFNEALLVSVNDHLIHRRSDLQFMPFLKKIKLCMGSLGQYKSRVLTAREGFSIDSAVDRYLEILKKHL